MSKQDYIQQIENAERRFFSNPVVIEKRADGSDVSELRSIEGYAALYNSRTDLGYLMEEIAPGAFDNVLNNDVRCLFNHDPNFILARSVNGTLALTLDERGLKYSYTTPDRTYARDLQNAIESGDVSESSFGFIVEEAEWNELENGVMLRRITKIKELFDVSPVTYPAYKDTSVAQRSLTSFNEEQAKQQQSVDNNNSKALDVFEAQLIVNKFK